MGWGQRYGRWEMCETLSEGHSSSRLAVKRREMEWQEAGTCGALVCA